MSLAEIRQALFNCIEAVLQPEGKNSTNLSRISVGFQGVADVAGTTILWSPICRERDIPIKAWLEEHFSVPSNVANDCDMIAQALTWRDPETYGENFATILLAHGVGMGLLLRKEIVERLHV